MSQNDTVTAFAFVRESAISIPRFLHSVSHVEGVTYQHGLVGNYVAFVKVEDVTLRELQDEVVPGVHDAGGRLAEWSIALPQAFLGRPVKTTLGVYGALVQVSSTTPGAVDEFLTATFADYIGDTDQRGFAAARVQGGSTSHVIDLAGDDQVVVDELLSRFAKVPAGSAVDISFAVFDPS